MHCNRLLGELHYELCINSQRILNLDSFYVPMFYGTDIFDVTGSSSAHATSDHYDEGVIEQGNLNLFPWKNEGEDCCRMPDITKSGELV
jgi:hypothetical protein